MEDSPLPSPTGAETPAAPLHINAIEARVLGTLIEKAAITPDVYPLTINSVVNGCNQKTSREPIMHLEPGAVTHLLREMEGRGLVKLDPFSLRAPRYMHCFDAVYGVTARQRALLCVMLLRGPQTLNELHRRSERLADLQDIDDVRDTVERLIERDPPLVMRLPHSGGRREDRYMHLLSGPVDAQAYAETVAATSAPPAADSELHERVNQLEIEVAHIKEQWAQWLQTHPPSGEQPAEPHATAYLPEQTQD
ncbi:MAG: DUF480 domain-containing protein [Rhodanobacter sp.]|jgi:uncharacterized protein YceH (UPF0502 family)|nr:DUF480 domain-containing protein [Rhodanobacter sp.]